MEFKELMNKAKSANVDTQCVFNQELVKYITEMRWDDESSIKTFVRLIIRWL